MSAGARPIWRPYSAASQPVRAAGAVSIRARIAWITRFEPFVDAEDIADVAVAALTKDGTPAASTS